MDDQITQSAAYTIRYTESDDLSFVRSWLLTPGVTHAFPVESEKEVEDFLKIYEGYLKYKCFLTAVYQDKVVGVAGLFLMPYRKVSHFAMGQIIVHPLMTGKGIGSSLIKNLVHLAKNYFRLETVQFEILGNSLLKRILLKQGFKEVFSQEDFAKEGRQMISRTMLEKDLR